MILEGGIVYDFKSSFAQECAFGCEVEAESGFLNFESEQISDR